MTPTLPFAAGRYQGAGFLKSWLANATLFAFTLPWNYTGQPAAAVPAGFSDNGLPLSVQLVGRPNNEATLVALAAQLEAARPWTHQEPPQQVGGRAAEAAQARALEASSSLDERGRGE